MKSLNNPDLKKADSYHVYVALGPKFNYPPTYKVFYMFAMAP